MRSLDCGISVRTKLYRRLYRALYHKHETRSESSEEEKKKKNTAHSARILIRVWIGECGGIHTYDERVRAHRGRRRRHTTRHNERFNAEVRANEMEMECATSTPKLSNDLVDLVAASENTATNWQKKRKQEKENTFWKEFGVFSRRVYRVFLFGDTAKTSAKHLNTYHGRSHAANLLLITRSPSFLSLPPFQCYRQRCWSLSLLLMLLARSLGLRRATCCCYRIYRGYWPPHRGPLRRSRATLCALGRAIPTKLARILI